MGADKRFFSEMGDGRAAGGVRPRDLQGRVRGGLRRKGAGKWLDRKDTASKRDKG